MNIYLAGPISGITYGLAAGWRLGVAAISKPPIYLLDPMSKINPQDSDFVLDFNVRPWPGESENDYQMVASDLRMVRGAQLIIVGFPTDYAHSLGTAVEVGVALERHIPIVIWADKQTKIHPFITTAAVFRHDDLDVVLEVGKLVVYERAYGR